ncbi:MAG: hypothetical protein KH135_00695 [Firmicutes bacterium]|nr:hypothetical protein [Bacillota bacterium]
MKVIKHGKNYIRYGKCDCGCEFEYDRKDTKAYKRVLTDAPYHIGGKWFEEREATKKELKDKDINFYVTCPECGNRVSVDREI